MGASKARKQARQQKHYSFGSEANASVSEAQDLTTQPTKIVKTGHVSNPPRKNQRFIVFIGNLPFTATDATIKQHFASLNPTAVRHRVDRVTGKSKGFAFLEFDDYQQMKICLKVFHHVKFCDGNSPARKLNVELTVGGGGARSKARRSKLASKNQKLHEQRSRQPGMERGRKSAQSRNEQQVEQLSNAQGVDIHPSRRSRILNSR